MPSVLLVEDDEALAETLREFLILEGLKTTIVGDGTEAVKTFEKEKFDLLILDVELPGLTGLEVCKRFRDSGGTAPVLMLTGRASIDDRIAGLEVGADDYLTKPFHPTELSARVRAVLRRSGDFLDGGVLKAGNISLDSVRQQVRKNQELVHIPRMEFALLEFFMRHPNKIFSAEDLLNGVWPADAARSPETIRNCIKRIRSRIDDQDQDSIILTVHGVGYKLNNGDEKS